MPDNINVKVLLFAAVADAVGVRNLDLSLPAHASLRDAVRELANKYPALAPWVERVSYARNFQVVSLDEPLTDGDEIALLPPVSGGEKEAGQLPYSTADGRMLITTEPLSLDAARELVVNPKSGAICVFAGTVREFTGNHRTSYLEYEAYVPMVVKEMQKIEQEIKDRWPEVQMAIHHRIGRLEIGEVSVVVAAAAPHRDEAFAAGRFGIDELKRRLPIWKKEVYADGSHWVGCDGSTPITTGDVKQ